MNNVTAILSSPTKFRGTLMMSSENSKKLRATRTASWSFDEQQDSLSETAMTELSLLHYTLLSGSSRPTSPYMWKVHVSSSRSMLVTPGTLRAC